MFKDSAFTLKEQPHKKRPDLCYQPQGWGWGRRNSHATLSPPLALFFKAPGPKTRSMTSLVLSCTSNLLSPTDHLLFLNISPFPLHNLNPFTLHFEEFYCGFCMSARAAFPSSESFYAQLSHLIQSPNCEFWKTSRSPAETKYWIGEGGGSSLLWSAPAKTTNRSLKAASAQIGGMKNSSKQVCQRGKRYFGFCTTSLFERPSPVMHLLLKFSVSFANAKEPVLTVNQMSMKGAKPLSWQEREKASSSNVFANLTQTKRHIFSKK